MVPDRPTMHGRSILTQGHAVGHLLVVHGVGQHGPIGLRGSHVGGDVISFLVSRGGKKQMLPVTNHVVYAVRDGTHSEGMNYAIGGHPSQTIEVAHITLVAEATSLLGLSMLLNVGLRAGELIHSGRTSTTSRAFLEVAFQNVTSRKRIVAKHANVRTIASVYSKVVSTQKLDGIRCKRLAVSWARVGLTAKQVALQVLCMKIGLNAVRARELVVSILGGNDCAICSC